MQRALLCGLILICACEKERVPPAPPLKGSDSGVPYAGGKGGKGGSTAGAGGTGGSSGSSGGSGGSGGIINSDAGVDLLAPTVTFLAPTATDDPNSDDVLTGTSFTVRCQVKASEEPGAAMVDKSAVKLVLHDPRDPEAVTNGAVSAVTDTEYEATFQLSALPNGPITVDCTGKDLGNHMATASLTTLLDLGPTITLKKPQDKKSYALKTPMAIEFEVAPAPLGDDDDKADVKNVALSVGGVNTPVSESGSTPGLYQTSIDFSDKDKFPVQPTSAQLQFSASNERTPNAPTRIVRADVTIDGSGPSITVTSPMNGSIKRGVVELVVTANDPSGIMPNSLVATINTVPYANWDNTVGPTFKQSFDTNELDPQHKLIQLTINITAIDNVGNKTDPPVSHFVRLDNLPPVISLDPPILVESRVSGGDVYCSQPFDPVGYLAANDGDHVQAAKLFRALVVDRTNHAPGSVFDFHAGTDTQSVEMYTQALPDVPLLVDTNSDGICDAINKSDDMNIRADVRVTPDKDPVKIKLDAVNPGGPGPWFAKTGPTLCPNDPNGATEAPATVCPPYTEMSRVVPGPIQGKPPAVYAYTPSNSGSTGVCTGTDWNITGNTRGREGWLCVAARAVDTIGNIGVSEPIRLCFDDGEGAPPDCSGEPPTCRGSCTIAPSQLFAEDQIWAYQ